MQITNGNTRRNERWIFPMVDAGACAAFKLEMCSAKPKIIATNEFVMKFINIAGDACCYHLGP